MVLERETSCFNLSSKPEKSFLGTIGGTMSPTGMGKGPSKEKDGSLSNARMLITPPLLS